MALDLDSSFGSSQSDLKLNDDEPSFLFEESPEKDLT